MSFSVLAVASPSPALVTERECVGKTWPGWWDILSQSFQVKLDGEEPSTDVHDEDAKETHRERSVFIIGMRGAGKTTAGGWMTRLLNWTFIDLDQELERRAGCTIPEMIRGKWGWEGFRSEELALIKDVAEKKPYGHVFSCGGGIVETPQARQLLKEYSKGGGRVLLVHRDTDQVVEYLMRDKSRPAYTTEIRSVYERRKDWYDECCNLLYYSPHPETSDTQQEIPHDFQQFIASVSGRSNHLESVVAKDHSYFVSLTLPDLRESADLIPKVVVGSDAVELRVDLLQDRSKDSIVQQVSLLRNLARIPIVFTLRTVSQGGKFPDDAYEEGLELYRLALRLGIEYIDVEMTLPDNVIEAVTEYRGHSRIIASHHDPRGTLSWKNASWVPFYNKALQYGDIIKLVGIARNQEDNFDLAKFKTRMLAAQKTPIIAMNMGKEGKLSRVLNKFLTPVSHPALPFKAAPGQMSAAEIRRSLALLGDIDPLNFYLFGKPISLSRSPALHNTLFGQVGLPHQYHLLETDRVADVQSVIKAPDFGGASVTIPLKLDIMAHVDELTVAAKTIGAVNTIIPMGTPDETGRRRLLGDNTDWRGMVYSLQDAGVETQEGSAGTRGAMVVGAGGTTRAAIFALHSLGFSPIYVAARDLNKAKVLTSDFPDEYGLQSFKDASGAEQMTANVEVIISTIPADRPIDAGLQSLVTLILGRPASEGARRIVLEMAYKPRHTPIMQLAEEAGNWSTIPGLEVLASQGWYQFESWTGITPVYSDARAAVLGS